MKEYITPETLAAECREYEKIKAFNPHIVVNGKLEEPYYSIDYYDITEKEWHNGFGSSCLAYVQVWLRECFEEVDCAFMEVRHGRWIASHDEFCACSICKYPVYVGWNQTNYCPTAEQRWTDVTAMAIYHE